MTPATVDHIGPEVFAVRLKETGDGGMAFYGGGSEQRSNSPQDT